MLFSTCLFGIAAVARFGPRECLRIVIGTMVLGCFLSIYWVYAHPAEGMHHDFDAFQSQHAGLWRGIFSHKQGLGVFSGLTFGLLMFYGSMVFPSVVLRLGALTCAMTCLIGTRSATGMLVAGLAPALFYTSYWLIRRPHHIRKAAIALLPVATMVLLGSFFAGAFDFVPEVFGKSSDLTGRTEIWPLVMDRFVNSGEFYFGGGFGTGFSSTLSAYSIDNGYIDKIVEFGLIGAAGIFAIFAAMLLSAGNLVLSSSMEDARTKVFPIGILLVILFINVGESNLMYKHLSTVLMAIAVAISALERIERKRATPLRSPRDRHGGLVRLRTGVAAAARSAQHPSLPLGAPRAPA